jgi:HSP20 family molecular chaperone IbpA|uniref:SHSP domain-containing protein n=1 Tax=Panagrolaimus sp. PS1159 TaxID=55785 RepID=A0AC35F7P8_9BILA
MQLRSQSKKMSNSGERRIDVTRSNYSVIDTEFDSMRERFENEMRRVEDEMQRLRREFEGYKPTSGSTNRSYGQSGPLQSYNGDRHYGGGDLMSTRPIYDPYLDNLKSPLIKDESDGKTLRLRFDVAQYKPEEVTVKTVDNRLLVHAKHEEKTPSRTVYREYNQEFMLPRGTNPESISSTLSTDGVLTVEAPLPQLAIQH